MNRPGWLTYSGQFIHGHPSAWRSSTGQGKCAGQRPTFYHCATQPTSVNILDLVMNIVLITESVADGVAQVA